MCPFKICYGVAVVARPNTSAMPESLTVTPASEKLIVHAFLNVLLVNVIFEASRPASVSAVVTSPAEGVTLPFVSSVKVPVTTP